MRLAREIRRRLLGWLHQQFLSGVHPENLFDLLAAEVVRLKSAKIEDFPNVGEKSGRLEKKLYV